MTPLLRNAAAEKIGQFALNRHAATIAHKWLSRPFSSTADLRVCIYFHPDRISFSQVFPFLFYAPEFKKRFGAEIRFVPVDGPLNGEALVHENCDIVLVQTWLTVDKNNLRVLLERIRRGHPNASVSFLDSFAQNDLRLAETVDPYIDHYIKKTLFKDRKTFLKAFRGDTNLTEFYGKAYGIDAAPVDWNVPLNFLNKLRLGAGFFTAPGLISSFSATPRFDQDRPIDIHARLGSRGTPWYQAMRTDSLAQLDRMQDLNIVREGSVSWRKYIAEMKAAKICYSPFGYGEICWRDVEAAMTGAVLIKPDMGHLDTLPDMFEPGVTYAPVDWRFGNLEEVVRDLLKDRGKRHEIATEAHARISRYISSARFVTDMGFLFRKPDQKPPV